MGPFNEQLDDAKYGAERMYSVREFMSKVMKGELQTEERKCEIHGAYKTTMTPAGWTSCSKCRDEREAKAAKDELERQQAVDRLARAERLLKRAAIPPRFADRRLSNYVPQCEGAKRAFSQAASYAENFPEALTTGASLIMCGGVGTGKTHLAVGIAHAVLEMGRPAVFSSVMGAVRAVKETYRRDTEISERDAIDSFILPDLLILDEVGVQFGSDTEKLILFEIINGRYEALKPTILISNLAKDALAQFIGERVFDRLREGGGKLIAFDWPSYRRQA
jgi:DNA replication protein DnaC